MSNPITVLKQEYAAARKEWRTAMDLRKNAPFGREWSKAHSRVLDAMRAVESTKAALYDAIAAK